MKMRDALENITNGGKHLTSDRYCTFEMYQLFQVKIIKILSTFQKRADKNISIQTERDK